MLAVGAATCLVAPYNQVTGLVVLLPGLALLLAAPACCMDRRYMVLAALLALPSVGFLLTPLSDWWYIAAAWGTVLGALVLAFRRGGLAAANAWPIAADPANLGARSRI